MSSAVAYELLSAGSHHDGSVRVNSSLCRSVGSVGSGRTVTMCSVIEVYQRMRLPRLPFVCPVCCRLRSWFNFRFASGGDCHVGSGGLQLYARELLVVLIEQPYQLITRQVGALQPHNLSQRVLAITIPRQMQHPLCLTPLAPITAQPAALTLRLVTVQTPFAATIAASEQQHGVELVDNATLERPHQLLHQMLLARS